MNRKILVLAAALMAVATLASPVLAIGPENAGDNNPNVTSIPYGVEIETPSGVHQEWVIAGNKHLMVKDVRDFQIKDALVITDISQVAENENKWLFFSPEIWVDWLLSIFPTMPPAIANLWVQRNYPEGSYYREVIVGK